MRFTHLSNACFVVEFTELENGVDIGAKDSQANSDFVLRDTECLDDALHKLQGFLEVGFVGSVDAFGTVH